MSICSYYSDNITMVSVRHLNLESTTFSLIVIWKYSLSMATTDLHFIQHEFCFHHWVHLFSVTGEFTFQKGCIAC